MNQQEWKQAIISYLILNGSYDYYSQALDDVIKWSNQSEELCREVLDWCVSEGRVKLTKYETDFGVIDMWAFKKMVDIPILEIEITPGTTSYDNGTFTFELPNPSI